MRAVSQKRGSGAFTLIELLLTISIILVLVSLLLPTLNRGHQKARHLRCTANLRQVGFGMLAFAQAHEDKFPTQVSTNDGGSREFVEAGNSMRGDFYFSFKHFVPLAAEIQNPKVLVCPTDTREPAATFNSLSNTNLSYFVAANPQFANSDSITAGDRNLSPLTNSQARIGFYRPLKWTAEMHQNRGNVLFADGHVELRRDLLSLSNATGASVASLIMPSVKVPAAAGSGFSPTVSELGAAGSFGGSSPTPAKGSLTASFASTNQNSGLSNGTTTNFTITSGPRDLPRSAYLLGGPGGNPHLPDLPQATTTGLPAQVQKPRPTQDAAEAAPEADVAVAHEDLVESGKKLVQRGSRVIYGLPPWVVIALLLLLLWLLKRTYEKQSARPAKPSAQAPGWFFARKP
jgi:prepilin-type processing-associated H-X9-DG protein